MQRLIKVRVIKPLILLTTTNMQFNKHHKETHRDTWMNWIDWIVKIWVEISDKLNIKCHFHFYSY